MQPPPASGATPDPRAVARAEVRDELLVRVRHRVRNQDVEVRAERASKEYQTATRWQARSVVTCGCESSPESLAALLLSGAGASTSRRCCSSAQSGCRSPCRSCRQGCRWSAIRRPSCPRRRSPPGALVETRVGRRIAVERRWGGPGRAVVARARNQDVEVRADRPKRESFDDHTATQLPAPSVVTWGKASVPKSNVALVLSGAGAVQVAPLLLERATRMSRSETDRVAQGVVRLPDGDPVAGAVSRHLG